ncbi:hypothetical protein [Achromobacter sp. HZ01]|uniref:hypothetical protein n=1 Tax=Achromobacter sp. HZ01 TaxID=1416886 RepID=UPI0011BF3D21|nr:hypothetical protein [Achromobacter sp. HZ01]
MKVDANFRRRAVADEDVRRLNSTIVSRLSKIDGIFRVDDVARRVVFDQGTGESAEANLSPCLIQGIRGGISYASRRLGAIRDHGTSDDFIRLELDLDLIDYLWFVADVFPAVVEAFEAYRSTTETDEDQMVDDFEKIIELSRLEKKDILSRDGVFRIQSVNYFDDILCRRAFGIGSKEVVARLEGHVYVVREIGDGVFFITSDKPVAGPETLIIDEKIKRILAGK